MNSELRNRLREHVELKAGLLVRLHSIQFCEDCSDLSAYLDEINKPVIMGELHGLKRSLATEADIRDREIAASEKLGRGAGETESETLEVFGEKGSVSEFVRTESEDKPLTVSHNVRLRTEDGRVIGEAVVSELQGEPGRYRVVEATLLPYHENLVKAERSLSLSVGFQKLREPEGSAYSAGKPCTNEQLDCRQMEPHSHGSFDCDPSCHCQRRV